MEEKPKEEPKQKNDDDDGTISKTISFGSFQYELIKVISTKTDTDTSRAKRGSCEETFYLLRSIEVNECTRARTRRGSNSMGSKEKKRTGKTRLLVHMTVEIEAVETTYVGNRVRVRRALYRADNVEKFITEFRDMVKFLRERIGRLDMTKLSLEIQHFTEFVYTKVFLKDTGYADDWVKTMFKDFVSSLMREMLKFVLNGTLGGRFVRQVLDHFFGIKSLAESSFTERKLFLTSLSMARAKGPLWNEIYLRDGTSTNVIVGQLPTQWHIQMLHECRNVRSVLSVCEPFELEEVDGRSAWHVPGIIQKKICIQDFRGGGGPDSLFGGMQFIEQQLQIGAVYVHCKAGKGRSVLMVMAYLMKIRSKYVTSPLDALHVIMMHRPQINPDTIMTHTKVKEAHLFWLKYVMNLHDMLKGGLLLVNKNLVLDMETWLDSAVGSGFFSNDKYGYLYVLSLSLFIHIYIYADEIYTTSFSFNHDRYARDKLEKYYGGSAKSQELHDLTTPSFLMKPSSDEYSMLDSKERLRLWKSHFGLLCGENKKRLEELHTLNHAKPFENIAKSMRRYDKKNIMPLRRVRQVLNSTCKLEKTDIELSVWSLRGSELHGVFTTDASPDDFSVDTSTDEFWRDCVVQSRPKHEAKIQVMSEPECLIIIELKEKLSGVQFLMLNNVNSANIEVVENDVNIIYFDLKSVFIVRHKSHKDAEFFAKLLQGSHRQSSSSEFLVNTTEVSDDFYSCDEEGCEKQDVDEKVDMVVDCEKGRHRQDSLVDGYRRFTSIRHMNHAMNDEKEKMQIKIPKDGDNLSQHQA
jgi:atypical dual specificity phosphatase